jgi:hypothetical protein
MGKNVITEFVLKFDLEPDLAVKRVLEGGWCSSPNVNENLDLLKKKYLSVIFRPSRSESVLLAPKSNGLVLLGGRIFRRKKYSKSPLLGNIFSRALRNPPNKTICVFPARVFFFTKDLLFPQKKSFFVFFFSISKIKQLSKIKWVFFANVNVAHLVHHDVTLFCPCFFVLQICF